MRAREAKKEKGGEDNKKCSSHVVSMDSQGEAASIPSEIMQYSIQQGASGQVNVQTTLKLLASPACHLPDVPGAEESSDHFISHALLTVQVRTGALKWLTTRRVRPTGPEPQECKVQNRRSSDPIVLPMPSLVGF
uniref:Uncharacterized protein n=1 Tax=Timema cristinae TaxID=61476 RepID=A0A7R9CKN5_TIMCR|nr:unnamed protein product [Timema cristinae]